jgi:hypothetical protein
MPRFQNHYWPRIVLTLFVLVLAACAKGPGTETTDASIGDSLKAAFYSDPELKNDRIDVSVSNGEVTLSGEVSTDAGRLQAYKLANETPGVKKVVDMLQVKSSQAALEQPAGTGAASGTTTSAPRPAGRSSAPSSAASSSSSSARPPDASAPAPAPAPAAAPAAPSTRTVTIPAGTSVRIQMIDSVDSAKHKVGDTFLASLDAPITVGSQVVVPKGTDVYVKLTNAKTSGKFTGQSELELELDHLKYQGQNYNLASSTYEQVGGSRGKDTAKKTAIGAAVGTAIGAIAGGGKGAAIGAGIGAGSGAAAQIFMKGKQVQVPSETKIDFQLDQPVAITQKK